jgi:hypothetical protein
MPEACRGTGISYFKLGKYQDSVGYFQKVINDYLQYAVKTYNNMLGVIAQIKEHE